MLTMFVDCFGLVGTLSSSRGVATTLSWRTINFNPDCTKRSSQVRWTSGSRISSQ